jgi:hypothetical protein
MSSTVPLVHYLFTRLRQIGIDSVHGVPGDYNLVSLDYLEPAGLRWIGDANELNAGKSPPRQSHLHACLMKPQAMPPTDMPESKASAQL